MVPMGRFFTICVKKLHAWMYILNGTKMRNDTSRLSKYVHLLHGYSCYGRAPSCRHSPGTLLVPPLTSLAFWLMDLQVFLPQCWCEKGWGCQHCTSLCFKHLFCLLYCWIRKRDELAIIMLCSSCNENVALTTTCSFFTLLRHSEKKILKSVCALPYCQLLTFCSIWKAPV